MEAWELSDEAMAKAMQSVYEYTDIVETDVDKGVKAVAQAAQKKLVEAIKKDTNDNLFGISDDLWKSMCKTLEVK